MYICSITRNCNSLRNKISSYLYICKKAVYVIIKENEQHRYQTIDNFGYPKLSDCITLMQHTVVSFPTNRRKHIYTRTTTLVCKHLSNQATIDTTYVVPKEFHKT